jgi:hypothetical protein
MRSRLLALGAIAAVSLSAVGLAACGDDETSAAGDVSTQTMSEQGSVTLTMPQGGMSVDGKVTATVDLADFMINADAVGMAPAPKEGHLHFSMDGGTYDFPQYSGANGKLAETLGVQGKYSPSVEPTITYENLPPGEHTLEVYLANNDHSNAGPSDSVTFTVGDGSDATGSVIVDAPADGSTVKNPVKVMVDLNDFEIDAAAVGKAAMAGQGHVHFSMDGGKYDLPRYSGANGELAVKLGVQGKYSPSVTPSITYRNLPKGEHTLTVFLANNDHSAAGPTATTRFTVE